MPIMELLWEMPAALNVPRADRHHGRPGMARSIAMPSPAKIKIDGPNGQRKASKGSKRDQTELET